MKKERRRSCRTVPFRLEGEVMRKLIIGACLLLVGAIAPAPRSAPEVRTALQQVSELPLPAQARISTALGRDDVEYHAAEHTTGFEVRNAGHGFAAGFTRSGIEVRSGTATWRLALRGYGYGDELRAAEPVRPVAHDNRVEYRRAGLLEWYVNGPLGVEQGFTLTHRGGEPRGRELTIAMSVEGNLRPAVDATGTSATLWNSEGASILRYSGLTAYDATGRELRAWMEAEANELILRIDDGGAAYPVVVDPFIERATLAASDGAVLDQFGMAVAIDGNTIVVGTLRGDGVTANSGAAYVFEKPPGGWSGPLVENAKLMASDGTLNASFGSFVAIDGDTIAIGTSIGAAYVFVRPAGGWSGVLTQDARLTPSECCNNPFTVAVSGDTVVGGSMNKDFPGSFEQGAAYVFVKPPSGWANMNETARLLASDGAAGDFFGCAVATDGDTVVVGSQQDEPGAGGAADHGSAYVFVKPGAGWSGTVNQAAKLTASDAALGDLLGRSVAISGTTVAAGAPRKGSLDQGGAYVFEMPPGGWTGALTESARLIASDGGGNFGASVAVGGNTVVSGAPLNSNSRGAAYVFLKPASGWNGLRTETQKLVTSHPVFVHGLSVAITGGTILVGQFNTLTIVGDKGAAYIFEGSAADAGLSMSAAPAPVVAGSDITYTIVVTNDGPDEAPSVVVTDNLPGELTFVSCTATGTGICEGSANNRTVTFPALAAGASETIKIVATVNSASADGSTITNTVSVWTATTDPNSANDTASSSTSVVQQADLLVTKTAPSTTVAAGSNIAYTIVVTNNGPNSASDVTLIDNVPAGTGFVSRSGAAGWTCVDPPAGSAGPVTCSIGSLAGGATATFVVETSVSCGVSSGTVITNTASVGAGTSDPDTANNSSTTSLTVSNPSPVVTAAVSTSVLTFVNNPPLVNVGLSATVNDGGCAAIVSVEVHGDENDETPITRSQVFSPDARDIAPGTLRLRAERVKGLDGRVYLIVVKATDAAGATGFATTTVVVPHKANAAGLSSVSAQAAAAKAYADSHGGSPPSGFFVIGDGPVIGPLQ